jgi:L-lactate dehydrogenase
VALAVSRIARAILRDENAVLTVSSLMKGYYGVEDMSLSLPTLINSNGIKNVLELPLAEAEEKAFKESAQHLKDNISELDI